MRDIGLLAYSLKFTRLAKLIQIVKPRDLSDDLFSGRNS